MFKFIKNLIHKTPPKVTDDTLFLEHPGEGDDSVDAAVHRLFGLLESAYPMKGSLNLSAQGQGATPESYHIVDVLYRDHQFDTGKLEVPREAILDELKRRRHDELAGSIGFLSPTIFTVSHLKPDSIAKIALALFAALGVKPFEDENDHPLVVEWEK